MADMIKTATRDAYGKALVELGEKNPDILPGRDCLHSVICADECTDYNSFMA